MMYFVADGSGLCVCVCLCLCVRRPLPIRLNKGTKCVQQTGGCATLRQHVLGMECCAGYEPAIGGRFGSATRQSRFVLRQPRH